MHLAEKNLPDAWGNLACPAAGYVYCLGSMGYRRNLVRKLPSQLVALRPVVVPGYYCSDLRITPQCRVQLGKFEDPMKAEGWRLVVPPHRRDGRN